MNAAKRNSLAAELEKWWQDQANAEIEMVVGKAVEYGGEGAALDLIDIGRDLARMAGREVDDEEAAELGCLFYARGKIARAVAAVIEGRRASDDTWADLGVYTRMIQRIRQVGGWPFSPNHPFDQVENEQ